MLPARGAQQLLAMVMAVLGVVTFLLTFILGDLVATPTHAEGNAAHAPPPAQETARLARAVRTQAAGGEGSAKGEGGMGRGGDTPHIAPGLTARS